MQHYTTTVTAWVLLPWWDKFADPTYLKLIDVFNPLDTEFTIYLFFVLFKTPVHIAVIHLFLILKGTFVKPVLNLPRVLMTALPVKYF